GSQIFIDRMEGKTAELVRTPSSSSMDGPTHVLQVDGRTVAGLWVADGGEATVRATVDPAGPMIGTVKASSEQGMIRLTFKPTNGAPVYTDGFDRTEAHLSEPNALGATMLSVRDLPGVYRTHLCDGSNIDIGWFKVSIAPYMAASRGYTAVLPPGLNGTLAAAAVVLLESQIHDIERAALDDWIWD
ncbi:MAG: hypothetical protein ACRDL7_15465, partial [Gaiellaceae bacterium]